MRKRDGVSRRTFIRAGLYAGEGALAAGGAPAGTSPADGVRFSLFSDIHYCPGVYFTFNYA